jgi:uncharacterized protein YidB (DUF937 family)/outer membrane protein OmpA-like peptidoglycan-associated protein
MFDLIIKEAASRFGLGDKGGMLVQMLLSFMTNKDTGGLGGFMNLFKNKGMGDLASSWLGGGAGAKEISGSQLESLFGGKGGLLESVAGKTGLGGSAITSAMGFLLPSIIGKLTPGGSIPTSLPADVMGLADQGKNLLGGLLGSGATAAAGVAAGAAALGTKAVGNVAGAAGNVAGAAGDMGAKAGGGLMRWLPWLIAAAVGLYLLKSCTGGDDMAKKAAEAAKAPVAAVKEAAKDATAGATDAAKAAAATAAAAAATASTAATTAATAAASATTAAASGVAAALTYLDKAPDALAGAPSAKVYFDSGKVDLPADIDGKLKAVIDYVKGNVGTKGVISGFHDPSGDKAQNEELAKNRAKMVRERLRAAGFTEDQILMIKPFQTAGSGDMKEARRVEVTVIKAP